MNRWKIYWATSLVFFFLLGFYVPDSHAIPPFARKYQVSCSLCHKPPPRLNEFGEAFRLAGFRIPDGEEIYIKSKPVALEPEAFKKIWPKQIYPTNIPGLPPVGFRVLLDAEIDVGGESGARSTFKFPDEVEILTAGSFGDNASFHAEMEFEDGETSTVPWIRFEKIFGTSLLNLKAGVVGGHTFGLPGALDSERITRHHYLYVDWRMPGAAGLSTRNRFRIRSGQPGLELTGYKRNWKYALGVVNGNDGSIRDNNSAKDGFFQFAAKVGGIGYDGSKPGGKNFWSKNSLQMGLFSYWGRAKIENITDTKTDNFYRLGPDIRFRNTMFDLGGGYLYGKNNRPFGALNSSSVDSHGWYAEAIYHILPWLDGTLRYEGLRVDIPTAIGTDDDRDRFIPSISALIRANIRLILEGRFHAKDKREDEDNDNDQVLLRMDFSY